MGPRGSLASAKVLVGRRVVPPKPVAAKKEEAHHQLRFSHMIYTFKCPLSR